MSYWRLKMIGSGPIEARHRWIMPGMNCPVCKRVWTIGAGALPGVDLEGTPADSSLRRLPYPVLLDEWRRLAEQIRPFVPASEPIEPGLALGPLKGRSVASFRVTWNTVFGIVLTEEVRDEFASLAPDILLVRCDLKGLKLPCYELEFRCYGAEAIEEKVVADRCKACGYRKPVSPVHERDYCIRNVPDAPLFTLRNRGVMIAHDSLIPFFERELGRLLEVRPIEVET